MICLIMLCSILTSQEPQDKLSPDSSTIFPETTTQKITYRELYEVWQDIHSLYEKITTFEATKEEEQKFVQLLYKYFDVISIHQSSELYTFMQIHDFPNYENLSFCSQFHCNYFYLSVICPLNCSADSFSLNIEKIQDLFESILSLKKTSLKNMTSIVRNLVPLEITSEKYKQTLNDLVNKFTKDWGIPCNFYAPTEALLEQLSDTQKIHIYRIIQEAMTNAAKHAKAEEIVVAVREDTKSEPNKIFFFITDDGCGMDMNKEDFNPEMSTNLGLKGMYARSQIINANLDISSDEETGTQVTLSLEMPQN